VEKQLDPVSVVLLTRVIHDLAHVAKEAENSADVIARMVLRK
jgi:hypothetical protein